MANTEQIEAKLCAYVDDELDAAGRAEIEQHLEANPQHRALLAELMAQRDLLRALPREKAPDDLFDFFQTHLERSILLEGDRRAGHVAGRINPWPQVFSIAAVLLLAVGLLTVIYFVLPNQREPSKDYALHTATRPAALDEVAMSLETAARPTTVASATPEASAAPPGAVAVADHADNQDAAVSAPTAVAVGKGDSAPAIEEKAQPTTDPFTMTVADARDLQLQAVAGRMFDPTPLDPRLVQRVKDSPQVPENSMLLVFRCADPVAADRQVAHYLVQNSIQWEEVAEAMPEPLAMKQTSVYGSKIQSRSGELRRGATAPLAKGDAPARATPKDDESEPAPAPAAAPPPTAPAAVAATPAAPPGGAQKVSQAAAPGTQPADKVRQRQMVARQIRQEPIAQEVEQDLEQSQSEAPAQRLIVARGLTRSQVAELNTSLLVQNAGCIANYQRSGGVIVPAALPIGALGGGAAGDMAQAQSLASAATQPELAQRDEAKKEKKEALDADALYDHAVTTAPATATLELATTQPQGEQLGRSSVGAASQPATIHPIQVAAITGEEQQQTLTPTTSPTAAEERFDVVIVVKSDDPAPEPEPVDQAAAPTASEPATAPAPAPPTTENPPDLP